MTISFNSNIADIAARTKVALIQSCWHRGIVDEFRDSFLGEFEQMDGRTIETFAVPGAFELPLRAKQLAATGEYAAVVATGLVVDGGIYRHDFVATAVIHGLMQVQLDTGVPVFSGVLTPHDFMSEGRADFFNEHFVIKGVEVAKACAETLGVYYEEEVA
jgi:6,7-dimethyl-8-ribityllumazine synthase